jgi:hypothetical protein
MLDLMLPRILGGALSANNVPFAETLPAFDVLVDKIAQRHVFTSCKVNKATFSAKPNEKVKFSVDVKGVSETLAATAFPAITVPTEAPWSFAQGVITLNSVVRAITDFTCSVDNVLKVRFTNSQTATDISPSDQHVTLAVHVPYTTDNTDLYNQGTTATAATLVFTNGSEVLTFTFGALQYEDTSPTVATKEAEILLPITCTARKTGATHALNFTITP